MMLISKMDIKEITEALYNDNEEVYTQLYTRFSGLLYGYIFKLTKSDYIAEDIVQETFIKIWMNRKKTVIQTSFKSYLFTIAQNMVIDAFRHRINKPEMTDYLELLQGPYEPTIDSKETIDLETFYSILQQAKNKLTKQQRLIFVLCKENDKKISEVAELLNITEQSVRNQLSMALNKMRKYMSEYSPLFIIMLYNI